MSEQTQTKSVTMVHKYGGSSITSPADVERIRYITDREKEKERSGLNIVIVSAPGKVKVHDKKVTDMLVEIADGKHMLIDKVMDIYASIFPQTDISYVHNLLRDRINKSSGYSKDERLDSIISFGEEACGILLSETLAYNFVDPGEIILVPKDSNRTRIFEKSKQRIRKYFKDRKGIFVVPGFYGVAENGRIATFSRGGSDITGALISASLNAKVYNKFTDQDGVFAAHPRIVSNPKIIKDMTFGELRDLSYSGFRIFNSEAIEPIESSDVMVHIRNTSMYPEEGTHVVSSRSCDSRNPIIGVAYQDGFCSFSVSKTGLNDIRGVLSDLVNIFKHEGLSIDHVLTGIDDISIVFKKEQESGYDRKSIEEKIYRLRSIGEKGTRINVQDDLGCLVIAGIGIKDNRLISADVEHTISENGIDVVFKSQGAERRCVVFGVNKIDGERAVKIVYENYIGKNVTAPLLSKKGRV